MIYEYNNENVEELILKLKEDDIVQMHAEDFLKIVGKSGKPKGRKPIAFDEEKFIEVVNRWQSGVITARAAMNELDLKPNTFYRRVKEYTEMGDIKEIKKAIKEEAKDFKAAIKAEEKEIKASLKAEKEDIKELKAQVKAEAKEVKKQIKEDAKEAGDKVEETISLKKMEKEILKEKLEAEIDHAKEVKALEKEVAAEAEGFKENL